MKRCCDWYVYMYMWWGSAFIYFIVLFFHQPLQTTIKAFYTRGLMPLLIYMYCHEEHIIKCTVYSQLPLLQTPTESIKAGIYFSQMSVNYFCHGFICSPYYWGVRNNKVSTRREWTVSELYPKKRRNILSMF